MMRLGDGTAEGGDGDGEIDFDEFVHVMKVVNAAAKLEKLRLRMKSKRAEESNRTAQAVAAARVASSSVKKKQGTFVTAEEEAARAEAAAEVARKGMSEWTKWIARIGVAPVVMGALKLCFKDGEQAAFDYMRTLNRQQVMDCCCTPHASATCAASKRPRSQPPSSTRLPPASPPSPT